jgi:hypothetical protein
MKALAAAIGAVALLGGLQALNGRDAGAAVAAGGASAQERYRLVADGGHATCMVARGARLSGGLSELIVDAECSDVLPGIERARFWREREDGTVGFSDGRTPVASFELGDGVAYESYAPVRPLLTLVAE